MCLLIVCCLVFVYVFAVLAGVHTDATTITPLTAIHHPCTLFLVVFQSSAPVRFGLADPKLGSIERGVRCESCSGDHKSCPGHFGHIELARPMFHMGFLPVVKKVLTCICFYCSKLRISTNDMRYKSAIRYEGAMDRLRAVVQLCQNIKVCDGGKTGDDDALGGGDGAVGNNAPEFEGCGHRQPKFRRSGLEIIATFDPAEVEDGTEAIRSLSAEVRGGGCDAPFLALLLLLLLLCLLAVETMRFSFSLPSPLSPTRTSFPLRFMLLCFTALNHLPAGGARDSVAYVG